MRINWPRLVVGVVILLAGLGTLAYGMALENVLFFVGGVVLVLVSAFVAFAKDFHALVSKDKVELEGDFGEAGVSSSGEAERELPPPPQGKLRKPPVPRSRGSDED